MFSFLTEKRMAMWSESDATDVGPSFAHQPISYSAGAFFEWLAGGGGGRGSTTEDMPSHNRQTTCCGLHSFYSNDHDCLL